MKPLVRLFTLLFIIFAVINPVFSQKYLKKIKERGELRVGMTAKQPPFAMKDIKGNYIGFEVELAEMLAESMELNLKIVEIPFSMLLKSLEDGDIDMVMSGMTMTIKRNMKAIFVGPYLLSGKSILAKSTTYLSTDEAGDLNKSDLRIVALKGSTSELYVKNEMPDATLLLGDDYDACIKILEKNDAQIMVADYPICVYTALLFPEKGLFTIDTPLTIEPIGVALPNDAAHFINLVENYFNKLSLIGALEEMNAYWFDSGEWVDQVVPVKGIQIN
ncbi:transporter substrate-binding domain-containing protein [Bacteroidota bacterium]